MKDQPRQKQSPFLPLNCQHEQSIDQDANGWENAEDYDNQKLQIASVRLQILVWSKCVIGLIWHFIDFVWRQNGLYRRKLVLVSSCNMSARGRLNGPKWSNYLLQICHWWLIKCTKWLPRWPRGHGRPERKWPQGALRSSRRSSIAEFALSWLTMKASLKEKKAYYFEASHTLL